VAPKQGETPVQEHEQAKAEVELFTNKRLLEQFAEMAVAIPREDGDGTENILTQLFAAESWDDLNTPWDTSSVDDIIGKRLKLTHVTRRPSTFSGGLGQFLVCHLTDIRTGKTYVKSTGSIAIVGQIAMAYFKGWMPLQVEWVKAERATENGYYPQHLKLLDSFAPGPDDTGGK
jgi:hypothetical protein